NSKDRTNRDGRRAVADTRVRRHRNVTGHAGESSRRRTVDCGPRRRVPDPSDARPRLHEARRTFELVVSAVDSALASALWDLGERTDRAARPRIRSEGMTARRRRLERQPVSYRLLRAWAWSIAAIFYRKVEVTADSTFPTDAPVILAANHTNALADVAV